MANSSGPTQGDYNRTAAWKPRPWVARVLTVVVRGAPILVSTGSGLVAARALPRPHGWTWVPWAFAVVAIAQLALRFTELSVRRFVPLTTLLRFSLVFPDNAPKRFATALRSGNVERMRRDTARTAESGLPINLNEAAITALQMVASLNEHDRGTRGHSERVRAITEMLAEEMQLDQKFREKLRWGSLLHDMGKLTVPAEILNKPGRPTEEEWAILARHPAEGGRILAPLADWLGDAVNAASQHHERWDGKGYPLGLAGEQISFSARIVAVADAYAVMTAARSYKKPLPLAVAREELTKNAGTQFDPAVVRAMLTVSIGKTSKTARFLSSLANLPVVGSIVAATAPTAAPVGISGLVGVSGLVSSGAAAAALTASMVVPTPAASWVFERPISSAQAVEFSSGIAGELGNLNELALVDDEGSSFVSPTTPKSRQQASSTARSDAFGGQPSESVVLSNRSGVLVRPGVPGVSGGPNADGTDGVAGSSTGRSGTGVASSTIAGTGSGAMATTVRVSTTVADSATTVPSETKPPRLPPFASTTTATTVPTTVSPTTVVTTTADPSGTKPATTPTTVAPITQADTKPTTTKAATTILTTVLPTTPTTLLPTTVVPTTPKVPTTVVVADTTPPIIITIVITTPPILGTTVITTPPIIAIPVITTSPNSGKGGSGNSGSGTVEVGF